MVKIKPLLVLFLFSVLMLRVGAYTTSMHAPAVLGNENIGTLTTMQLNLTYGNGSVEVNGPSSVNASTFDSAETAATAATSLLGLPESNYNFNYTILDWNTSVSGPSAGLVFTLLAVSALQQRQLAPNFTATGTIAVNGSVGLVGGVYDKTGAAKAGGMRFILVPNAGNSTFEKLVYLISQQVYGLDAVEVSNVSQALPYAFGTAVPQPLTDNLSIGFNLSAIPDANVTCSDCNTSAFGSIVNYTFGFVNGTIANISRNFTGAKVNLTNSINMYRALAGKGYLYSGADFAFLDFFTAFTLANSQNVSVASASEILANITSYCSSLTPPQMTDTNYEYIITGEIRLLWANTTLTQAKLLLGSEQTSDDILQSIYTAAPALGWCNAANSAFDVASNMSGNYVQLSPRIKTVAAAAINRARFYGSNIYLQSAISAYSAGDYATALYGAAYAAAFGPTSLGGNMNTSQLESATLQNIGNATNGIWPSQLSAQAELYLDEAHMYPGPKGAGYASQAYTLSVLAASLNTTNKEITSSFVASTGPAAVSGAVLNQINGIQQSISGIYVLLAIIAGVLLVILIILLVHILKPAPPAQPAKRSRR